MESSSKQLFVAAGNIGNVSLQCFLTVDTSAILLIIKELRAGSVHDCYREIPRMYCKVFL